MRRSWRAAPRGDMPPNGDGDAFGLALSFSGDGNVLAASAPLDSGSEADPAIENFDASARSGSSAPRDPATCFTGGGGYVFEQDAQGQWRHTAAAVMPLVRGQVGLAFSADAQTLALDASGTGATSISIY